MLAAYSLRVQFRLAIFASLATLVLGHATGQAASIASAASTAPAENIAPGTIGVGPLGGLQDLGRAPATARVDIAVVMQYRRGGELEALVEAQSDPTSPLFGRFLRPDEFSAYFAPAPADYGRVVATLERAGFAVTQTFPNRTVIDASAPAPFAERFLSTEIHRVVQPGEGIKYANVRPGLVPTSIRDVVLGVTGLSSVHVAHPDYVFGQHRAPVNQSVVDGKPLFGPDGGYGPRVFEESYDFPALKGITGTGRASGVAIDADFLDSDLAGYLGFFNVKRTGPATTRVLVDGGPPKGITMDSVETTLDVETIVSLSPGTALFVYEFPSFSTSVNTKNIIDAYNKIVADDKVDSVNSSFGLCESAFGNFPKLADHVALQGNAEGIAFHASTGDNGNFTFGCGNKVSVNAPAIVPHFIAVGGTSLFVDLSTGKETGEVAWASPPFATGGGVSVVFPVPSYQTGIRNVIARGRNDPDLAFDADPSPGASFFYQGFFQGPIGGTSLSSPMFGAALSQIAQMTGKRAGFVNPSLYKTWHKLGYKSPQGVLFFRDITQGAVGKFRALPGYDQLTGIGTMDVANFGPQLP